MKAIIVYYSYSGNTQRVADVLVEYLSQEYEVKTLRLEALDESTAFLGQAIRALFHKEARLSSVEMDLSDYDLICLGTPVWAFGPTPAINAYLKSCSGAETKTVILFSTYGSGVGVNKCFVYMREALMKKGVKDFIEFSIQQGKAKDKNFVNKIIGDALK